MKKRGNLGRCGAFDHFREGARHHSRYFSVVDPSITSQTKFFINLWQLFDDFLMASLVIGQSKHN